MDLQKIRVRHDLGRMVENYRATGDITEEQSALIRDYIDSAIGGGFFPVPGQSEGLKVIPFPGCCVSRIAPDLPPPRKEGKKPRVIEAMPWEPMPEGYPDYRPLLQRDGLIISAWAIYEDGIKVVWASANRGMNKYQAWVEDESEIPTVCPEEKNRVGYHHVYSDDTPYYTVYAAPKDLTAGTRAAFIAKLRESGVTVNFDYEFTLGRQKAAKEAAVANRIAGLSDGQGLTTSKEAVKQEAK